MMRGTGNEQVCARNILMYLRWGCCLSLWNLCDCLTHICTEGMQENCMTLCDTQKRTGVKKEG